jgi:hypothetical protein
VLFRSNFKEIMAKAVNAIAKFLKQTLLAPITDVKWDVDGAKLAGVLIVAFGLTAFMKAIVIWDFAPTPQIIAWIAVGSGLLGWRAHTDTPENQP